MARKKARKHVKKRKHSKKRKVTRARSRTRKAKARRKSPRHHRRHDAVWGNLRTKKQRQEAVRNIARVNEEFFRASEKHPPMWYFEWLGDNGQSHSGYNSVSAWTRAEAERKMYAMAASINSRPGGPKFVPDPKTLTTQDISRRWAAIFD